MNYLSRVSIDPVSVNAAQLAKDVCVNAYREHQHLWRLFDVDPDAKRDFLVPFKKWFCRVGGFTQPD